MSPIDDQIPSYDGLMQRIQSALSEIGEIERQLGSFEPTAFDGAVREDVNEAVRALQRARDRVQDDIGG